MYFVYGHLQTFYSLFAHILLGFCVLPVFVSSLFYREDIDILYTFQVVLRVYFTDIPCTFYGHYKATFCVHFIDIFCSSFGRNFMKVSLTFYLTILQSFFSLDILHGLCSHFISRYILIEFFIEKTLGFHGHFYAIWSHKMWSNLQTFYRVCKVSVGVHAYRHCILQGTYRDFTDILQTFVY